MTSRIAIVLLAALGFVACRPGEGDYCRCPDECRRGLVCAQSGAVIEACIDPAPGELGGRCIEADGAVDMVADDDTTFVDYHEDEGGKRDFEPGNPRDDESSSGTSTSTGTDATTTSTGTDATTSTGTSTSTGTTTGTGTGSTGQ
jgi:hypothetical protein